MYEMDILKILTDLSLASGPSGRETELMDQLIRRDSLRSFLQKAGFTA